MKFLIVSSAPIVVINDTKYAYSPYIKEMDLWVKHVDKVAFACPIWYEDKKLLLSKIDFEMETIFEMKEFNLKSKWAFINSFFCSLYNLLVLTKAFFWADHIHLRCPGNISLLAVLLQVFFPWKTKSVKYAGNWDPQARQPLSYRIQKKIVSLPAVTRNCKVLVYGNWSGSTKNIVPFFTATYSDNERIPFQPRDYQNTIGFVYTGMLAKGKRPMYAVKLVESLLQKGYAVTLEMYGTGPMYDEIQQYIQRNNLGKQILMLGNRDKEEIKTVLKKNHFIILPSQSEGWPKSIAEGMFWGCIPIATPVSCVPYMLDHGNRGVLLTMQLTHDSEQLEQLINSEWQCQNLSKRAADWSQQFTLDYFENQIQKLIVS